MTTAVRLAPAKELAEKNSVRFPGESSEYRIARNALLAEEIELRRHIERDLTICSDGSGDYTRDYVSAEDADVPGFSIFTRRSGSIRHFWSGEMGAESADPDQDPRGAPDLMSLWTILDLTPEGRGADWYPKLDDAPRKPAHT